ncbi:MAG: hypothetical protein HN341_04215 [Verrucomicrobia bacterium]|nr:hypothetical protein [Verrucomicrobiota bacterium]
MKSPKRKCRLFGKLLLWIAGILIVLRVAIPVVGIAVANHILPGILGTEASVDSLDMILTRGRMSISGIRIDQPKGFEGGPLFSLGSTTVDFNVPSMWRRPLTVESVTINSLEINIIRDTNGVLNVATLAGGSDTNAPAEVPEADPAETDLEPSTPSGNATAIAVEQTRVRNLSVSYSDFTYDPPLIAHIAECNLSATNVLFDPSSTAEELISTLELTAVLKQEGMHDGFVGIVGRLGTLSTNAPGTVAAVRIVGLELDPLGGVVPTGVAGTLGGSCVDAYVDLAMAVDILDCRAKVKTEDNTAPFAVGGTPTEPVIDKSTALFNLVGRPGALVGGVVTDVGSAGVEVSGAAAKTTLSAGKGVFKMAGSLGKGVYKTAKGVATADLGEIGDGLKTATVGTVSEGVNTVVDTASTAAKGVGDTATAAIGKDDTDAWRAGCEARWQTLWTEAQANIAEAPYPHPPEQEEADAIETETKAPVTDEADAETVTVRPTDEGAPEAMLDGE